MKNLCQCCGIEIVGRADKKYCSDQCRATAYNQSRNETQMAVIQINKILKKNRAILKKINPVGKTTIPKDFLKLQGFDFRFYTHLYSTNNNTYFFCYEYGYLPLVNDQKVVIINWQNYMKTKMKDSFQLKL